MVDLHLSNMDQHFLNKFFKGIQKKGDKRKRVIEAMSEKIENIENIRLINENVRLILEKSGRTMLSINDNQAQEVFEILCSIPFESASISDTEPPTKRHPAIESMIKQLSDIIDQSGEVEQK